MADLDLLKANLGISSGTTSRDEYLKAVLDATKTELMDEKGLSLDGERGQMFWIDYAAWRYRNRGEGTMPRNLQYRLHNLMITTQGGDKNE